MAAEKIYVKDYRELYESIIRKMKNYRLKDRDTKDPFQRFKKILLSKLQITYRMIDDELGNIIKALFGIKRAHTFYRELFETTSGLNIDDVLKNFSKYRTIARKLYARNKTLLKNSRDRAEATSVFKHGLGTLLSIYKRRGKTIEKIKKTLLEIYRLPDVSGDMVIVLTGMPQVGKSTLLGRLTRAKPEVSPYPFTTKNIVVGHLDLSEAERVVMIDAPGLLDRPLDERNIIEIRAILAIKHLADAIIYLFDANPSSYYTLDEQIHVYESITNTLGVKKRIIAINKVDATPSEILESVAELLREKTGLEPIPISALTGYNLDRLIEEIRKLMIEKTGSLGYR